MQAHQQNRHKYKQKLPQAVIEVTKATVQAMAVAGAEADIEPSRIEASTGPILGRLALKQSTFELNATNAQTTETSG